MAEKLPKVGVTSVVEGFNVFDKQMNIVIKLMQESGKAAEESGKGADKGGKSWLDLAGKMYVAEKAINVVTRALQGLGDFARRGAQFQGIISAFNNITGSAGILANELLTDLHKASMGTVSDFELMRLTNLALAGATGDFAKQFGESLPKLLEIARVQARATGQSVDYLYQSLVTGIKRGSPLLIDNTGLVIKAGAAAEAYAEKLGKTTDQLTSTERQQAILNATLEAGESAISAAGEQTTTVAEQMAQAGATITNIFDTLSVALQPIFNVIFGAINGVLSFISDLVTKAAPYIQAFAEIIGEGLKAIGDLFTSFIGEVNVGQIAHDFFTGAANLMGNFANGILWAANHLILPAVTGVANLIADFLLAFSPPKKGPLRFIREGGKNLMYEYIEGMFGGLDPIDQVAAEVDAKLGQLVGKITVGTIERRLAQLDRALLPFQNRLEIVRSEFEALSEPATQALNAIDRQIESLTQAVLEGDQAAADRLRMLDMQKDAIQSAVDGQQALVDRAQIQLALAQAQQAQERTLLEITKSRLPVQKRIEEAIKKSRKATGGGGAATKPKAGGGAAPTPELTGGAAIPGLEQTDPVDFFGGEDAIANARNEIEDAFLKPLTESGELEAFVQNSLDAGVAFDRMGKGFSNVGDKLSKIGKDFDKNIVQPIRKGIEDVANWLTDPNREYSLPWSINNAVDWLTNPDHEGGGLASGIKDASDWFTNENREYSLPWSINNAVDWLTNPAHEGGLAYAVSNLWAGVGDVYGSIKTWVEDNIAKPIRMRVEDAVGWLTDPEHDPPGLAAAVSNIFSGIGDIITSITEWVNTNIITPLKGPVEDVIGWLTDPEHEGGGLAYTLSNIFAFIGDIITSITEWVNTNIITPLKGPVEDVIGWLTDPEHEGGGLAYTFANLLSSLGAALGDVWAWFTGIWQPVVDWVNGTGDAEGGGLPGIINSIVGFFASLPDLIGQALRGLGRVIWASFVVPIISAVNWVIDQINNFIAGALDTSVDLLTSLFPNNPQFQLLKETWEKYGSQAGIAHLSTAMPDFLAEPSFSGRGKGATGGGGGASAGGATGGMFSGLIRVGERGEEFVSGSKIAVFPNEFVKAVDRLTAVIAQPAGMPIPGVVNNSTDNSINATFHGMRDGADVMRRIAMLQAGR